jgi:hypothetical protein
LARDVIFLAEPDEEAAQYNTTMHGNDERVSIDSLRSGTARIYETLVDVAARK